MRWVTHVEHSRTFPVTLEAAYAATLPVPLEQILGRRHLAIPAVTRVDQDRPWGEQLGQQRVIHFSDGGSTTEVLTVLEAPHRFGYTLSDVSGPMKLLIGALDGLWSFAPDGAGTRITWSWEIRPTVPGRLVMPAFAVMWRGMASRCFDRLGEHLTASPVD